MKIVLIKMSNRLKYIIGKEIISKANKLPLSVARCINVIRGNENNEFVIHINKSSLSKPDFVELCSSVASNKSVKVVQSEQNGFVKVYCERGFFVRNVLEELITNTTIIESKPSKIAIDFSSPNIAKPFHMGHLRSTIIGNFIANINKHFHNEVVKINYLGDWGTQFGLLNIGLRQKNITNDDFKTNPINTLYQCYVHANKQAATDESIMTEARKYFSEVEKGILDLSEWKEIKNITVDELSNTYKRLGVDFDVYSWESDYNYNAIDSVIKLLTDKNILRIDELGRKVATVKNKNVVMLKSDNSTMYLSRDVAALLDRSKKYNFDKMLYVVDSSQTDHFSALFEIARSIDENFYDKCEHVKFGRVGGMSTRKGTAVFLKDILDEAREKMREKQLKSPNTRSSSMDDDTCDILGTTAVIVNDLKQRRKHDYTFNWDRVLQTEGDSGIKLQYLHCRLFSIEAKCGLTLPDECDPHLLTEPIVSDLVTELAMFEQVLNGALEEREASYLVGYLFKLAKRVNKAVNELRVMNEREDVARQRLLLFHASRKVIKKSLEILGVRPLDQM